MHVYEYVCRERESDDCLIYLIDTVREKNERTIGQIILLYCNTENHMVIALFNLFSVTYPIVRPVHQALTFSPSVCFLMCINF